MQALARLERVESRNRRAAPRRQLRLGATLPETGDEAVIHDLSTTGILIETKGDLATFEQLQLELPEAGMVVATVLWNSGQYYGCEFHKPISNAAISAALLRNPIAGPPLESAEMRADEAEEEFVDDRYPLGVRLRVIIGASFALWALILFAAGVL
jgi:hypothetical protein